MSPLSPWRLLALAVVLALSACTPPLDTLPDPAAAPGLGGLTAGQMQDLRALGVPVLVPSVLGAFELASLQVEQQGPTARWALDYRRTDGACFEMIGGNEGVGSPDFPLVSTEVRIADLGRTVRVYEAADVPGATSAQVWGLGTVVSEIIDLDGATALFLSDTEGGCRPVSIDEGAQIVSSLRLLAVGAPTPPPGSPDLGVFLPAPDVLEDYNAASTPEAAAQAFARRYDGEADQVTVDLLSQTSYEATALVTLRGLRDDSVRDERLRLTYAPYGDVWELVQAGRQVRCQPGRGHSDWSGQACR